MKHFVKFTFLIAFCLCISLCIGQKTVYHLDNQDYLDQKTQVINEKLNELQLKYPEIEFHENFKSTHLLSGEIIKIYQKLDAFKNTKNHLLFRFDNHNNLISYYGNNTIDH